MTKEKINKRNWRNNKNKKKMIINMNHSVTNFNDKTKIYKKSYIKNIPNPTK